MGKKIIDRTSRWEVRIEGNNVVVDLFNTFYTEKDVLKILDAYRKGLYDRLNKELDSNLIKFKP